MQDEFASKAQSIYAQIDVLSETQRCLTVTRDLLLPRLISGKLSVEDLDIQFPSGMAEELNAEPTATVHA
jgi:type I restriction enzyme S subunit